ncbi:MAG: bifunctional DNA-formamidopyrimidine glycosylase/DNA-(apurinic or apyrimidinic site) lyase [Desulfovibrio sp.]|jgi:formamidopyrimidine-DNA glycosylase|nr:bifunctional DNA-formamidopyrimidine glycosylase/DNA-(apurinic or apyrimidinic site) lyase [Desulfovibrio sp.]
MPELPEVETIVRTLKPQILGRTITSLDLPKPSVMQAGADLIHLVPGMIVSKISRRAKLLLMSLSKPEQSADNDTLPDLILAFHLKMTGRFFVYPAGTAPLKHTRLILNLKDGGSLFFDDMRTFGYCRIMRPEDLADWSFYAALGPEPLGMSPADLSIHLRRVFAKRKRTVKAALLDQGNVAGIGNIYADESLFQSKIAPHRPAEKVSPEELLVLSSALQEILLKSIAECGSSIRDYRDAFGQAGAFQNSFSVYNRGGQKCLVCDKPLQSARIAGRSTVYCKHCQI